MMQKLKRAQSYEIKRRELLRLKAELKKARNPFRQAVLRDEIRAVARELAKLQDE